MPIVSRQVYLIFSSFMLFFLLPYLVMWGDAYIRVHDTLEGELIWFQLLIDSDLAFKTGKDLLLNMAMNGLPRDVLPTALNPLTLVTYLLGIYWGYIVYAFILKSIGFYGFYKLLSTKFNNFTLIALLSGLFISIPFYPVFGLSLMGLPLLLYSFIQLNQKRSVLKYLTLISVISFCSSLVWLGVPMFFLGGCFLILNFRRKIPFQLYYGLIACLFSVALAHYAFIQFTMFSGFQSHRELYQVINVPSFIECITETILFFFTCHYHVGTLFTGIILMFSLAVNYYQSDIFIKYLIYTILSIAIFQGFYPLFDYLFLYKIPVINNLKANRISIFLPFLWMLLFAYSVLEGCRIFNNKSIAFIVISQLIVTLIANDELQHNYRSLIGLSRFPSFHSYLATDLFKEINKDLPPNKASYRVVSIGISPTIPLYNGYYTLDGLYSSYPKNYKLAFRKIFEQELEKNIENKNYFDKWGNRCYLFPSELKKNHISNLVSRDKNLKIWNLNFNTQAFKELGGRYVFSGLEIVNANKTGLSLLNIYNSPQSFWKIYVYEAQ